MQGEGRGLTKVSGEGEGDGGRRGRKMVGRKETGASEWRMEGEREWMREGRKMRSEAEGHREKVGVNSMEVHCWRKEREGKERSDEGRERGNKKRGEGMS